MSGKRLRQMFQHPVTVADNWWARVSPNRRLDRNMGNMSMLIGLMLPSLAIVLTGPVPSSALMHMSDALQIWMCACIFFGCGIKLHGALSGSRWYFPHMPLKKSYSYGFIGAPVASAGLFVYGWFILSNTANFMSAMGAFLTPMLAAGISLQAIQYWLEYRRIDRNEQAMIAVAKKKIHDDGYPVD